MKKPELIFITGCNASVKSTFIRTRLNELSTFEIIMADVYKGRTKDVFIQALNKKKDIILETVFNDESFKDLVDMARKAEYQTSLVVLFLDDIQESIDRVAIRAMQQSGLIISGGNVTINFNEGFKNIATYFFYFDRSEFIYTGARGENQNIMRFKKGILSAYYENNLRYPQNFAQFSFSKGRLNEDAYNIITTNIDYTN